MKWKSELRFTFSVEGGHDFEVVEFDLKEALSEPFRLELNLASAHPSIAFGQILDQPATLTIWRADHPVRYCSGIISSFTQGETGFRRTRYQAVVEPPMARLRLSSDWRIFQTLSVPQITEAVLKAHHLTRNYEQIITNEHLPREYCVQAGDTDYDFLERILREEGFYFAFMHRPDGHRLIHSDRLYIHGVIEGGPVLYNPQPGGEQPEPALRRFSYTEHVRSARQVQRDYTFKHPQYSHEIQSQGTDLDHQGQAYERYEYPARAKKDEVGQPIAENRLRGHRRDSRVAKTEGDDPRLLPGLAFELIGHPRDDMNRGWRTLRMHHRGVQHTSQAEDGADTEQGVHYSYTAELVPDHVEWRAAPLPRPRMDGPQEATVVGPPGEEIFCDEWGRVKVRFPWDREDRHNDHSSCWIRVAQNWAGARWGHMAVPRIGQEVIVDFFNGDPDQPIITGRTYNAVQPPPYELPRHNTLSVIKSKEHKGQRASELRIDDTTREISAALMSDHGASHLHLGYLTRPRPDGGSPRGEGFELRTDQHGALRAAQGLLLTAEAQAQARGGQLDRADVVAALESALKLARSLGDYAVNHQGIALDPDARQGLTEAVRHLGHGANDQASDTTAGDEPIIALSAPAGIAAGTPESIIFGAGKHLDAAAQRNLQLTAGERIVINAGNGLGTFAERGDMRHIAHTGRMQLQAQHNDIQIEADKSVEIRANNHHVTVSAEEHITLLCGGAYLKMAGGNVEIGMPGTFTVKATGHKFAGPATLPTHSGKFSGLPGAFQEQFVLRDAETNEILPDHAYEIVRANGDILRGRTDEQGRTQIVTSDQPEPLEVFALPDPDDLLHLEAGYWDGEDGHSLDFLRNPSKKEG